jgi:hypothetical protein
MSQSIKDIIAKAKRQPRQGADPDPGAVDTILKGLDAGLATLIDTIGIFNSDFAQTLNITGKAANDFDKVSTKAKSPVYLAKK